MCANFTFHVKFAHMIKRRLESQLIDALERSPSVALLGPRQVGKTPQHIKDLQLRIWLSKTPEERLRLMMESNAIQKP